MRVFVCLILRRLAHGVVGALIKIRLLVSFLLSR